MIQEKKMVKDILFDLDDTLFDFHADEHVALTKTFAEMQIPLDDAVCARYSVINLAQWKALERGEITREQVKLRRFELLFAELGYGAEQAALAAKIYHKRLAEDFHYMEGAPELLEELTGKYRMFLISNGTLSVQEGRLAKSGIGRYFDGIFISEVLGAEKPSREFFDLAFAEITDFDPVQAVIVGDSLTSDIQGGINAGVRTIWLNPKAALPDPEIPADPEISELTDLSEFSRTL